MRPLSKSDGTSNITLIPSAPASLTDRTNASTILSAWRSRARMSGHLLSTTLKERLPAWVGEAGEGEDEGAGAAFGGADAGRD